MAGINGYKASGAVGRDFVTDVAFDSVATLGMGTVASGAKSLATSIVSAFERSASQKFTSSTFDIAPRVLNQLEHSRMGDLAGKISTSDLQKLVNNPQASCYLDMRPDNLGNINVIQEIAGK